MRRLYLDMDGVLADFDRAYEERFGVHPKQHDDKIMWGNIDGCEDFWQAIPPCAGAIDFYTEVAHLKPTILTACPKTNYAAAAQHKREWIRRYIGRDVTVLPVMGGSNKPLFMHARGDVLIDDFRRNTEAWRVAGGIAILHRNWPDTRLALSEVDGLARHPIDARLQSLYLLRSQLIGDLSDEELEAYDDAVNALAAIETTSIPKRA